MKLGTRKQVFMTERVINTQQAPVMPHQAIITVAIARLVTAPRTEPLACAASRPAAFRA
jgi:hypothetical protein